MTQFLRDEASDSEEVLTPLMLDGTYLSRNFATLGPFLTLQPPCVSWPLIWQPMISGLILSYRHDHTLTIRILLISGSLLTSHSCSGYMTFPLPISGCWHVTPVPGDTVGQGMRTQYTGMAYMKIMVVFPRDG